MKKLIYIYTDGACSGNPGKGGWGAYIKIEDQEIELFKSINVLSNNTNELTISYEKNALNISEIIKFINEQNIDLLDISTDDGDLEDVFLRLTKN